MKKCSTCKIIKILNDFNKNKSKKDGLSTQCKLCRSKYRRKNKIKIGIYLKNYNKINNIKSTYKNSNYFNNRYKNDLLFNLKHRISDLIRKSIKSKNYTKKSKTFNILGCEYEFFISYIEAQFSKDMTWKNIHLDHIKPISSAKNEKEIYELNHYTNFQPLLIKDNLIKSNKIINKQLKLI